MTSSLRNTVVVALAMVGAVIPGLVLTTDPRAMWTWAATITGLQLVAALVRSAVARRRGPADGAGAGSVLVSVAQFILLAVGAQVTAGLLTSGTVLAFNALPTVLERAVEVLSQDQPAPADDSTLLALAFVASLLTVLVDLVFIAARNAMLACMFTAVPFLVTVIIISHPVPVAAMAGLVISWCLLLWSRTLDHDLRWARLVTSPPNRKRWFGYSMWALVLTAVGLVGSLLAGLAIAPVERDLLPQANERSSVELTDPTVLLDQNLKRPEDATVATYDSSAKNGVMLRMAALTNVDQQGWHIVDMDLQSGFPEKIPGVSATGITDTTSVRPVDLDVSYLPLPYAPRRWNAQEGSWRYDPMTLSVVDVAEQPPRLGSYEVAHRDVEPSREQLLAASAGVAPDGDVANLSPADIPTAITTLTQEITAGANTDGEAAIALQTWLRDTSRFSYDLTVPPSINYDSLSAFLTQTHRGYCVHYAASMALMARSLGIPSRVGVGYTSGERSANGSWEVTAHDAHAWPELYFNGIGWVRFEPTVSVGEDPSWSTNAPTPSPSPTPSPTPSAEEPDTTPSAPPPPEQSPSVTPPNAQDGQDGQLDLPWEWIVAILTALIAGAVPMTVRTGIRRHRLSGEGAALVRGVFSEIRATAVDLDISWPELTLQQLAHRDWGLNAEASQAMRRILLATQELRFSARVPETDHLVSDVATVRAGWWASASSGRRLIARLLPKSLWH